MWKIIDEAANRFQVWWNEELVGTFSTREYAIAAVVRYTKLGGPE